MVPKNNNKSKKQMKEDTEDTLEVKIRSNKGVEFSEHLTAEELVTLGKKPSFKLKDLDYENEEDLPEDVGKSDALKFVFDED